MFFVFDFNVKREIQELRSLNNDELCKLKTYTIKRELRLKLSKIFPINR